jgi:hypothetical protein
MITRTETINAQKDKVTAMATVSVANGKVTNGELVIGCNIFGGNRLFIKDLDQWKDVVSVAQELLEAITERLG